MKYFLLSTSRSGSDLLRHLLINIFSENYDGPDEWIVHAKTRLNLGLPENYEEAMKMVLDNPDALINRMSPNSHRKVMYIHLGKTSNLPKHIPVIHLIRKDSLAQAISYWIMKKQVIPPHVKKEEHQALRNKNIVIQINYDEVEALAKWFYRQKQNWYYALKKRPNTLLFYYEDHLENNEVFKNTTLPRIEAFLNKKRQEKDFDFPFKKTSTLYTIENLDPDKIKKLTKKYYFKPSSKYWLKHQIKYLLGK
ncbi:hypothetical protein RXV94_04830 [Yeosuana sp. MJ-SS3]|uniref:Sulfotransferase domain-containing protein n=1 Tax=Gilvirhabdus luticola TaxID=3079858 RepID=A0ABU3U573_9FLAO|nr:hypothetical protein [Yeosuana sp. MJ-SS3]MDU8885476.1 hypothetical protein [Yeosuana sp. MJ-SS3]